VFALVAIGVAPPSRAQRIAVETPRGMVVAVHELAAQAGVEMLRRGGNAVDAAIATGFALAVVYPSAGNLGGGGFMVIHLASDRPGAAPATRDHAIDFREAAPAAATRDMYLGPDSAVRKGPGSSTLGWRASGVPGTVAGFALAFEKYGSGKLSWTDVIEPARRLAGEGHVLTAYNAARFRLREDTLGGFPESKRIFLKDGAFFETGELWRQPELAATLARLQRHGPREFYEGETARMIADAMAKHGGTITLADLKSYRPFERPPIRGRYRGYDLVTMPPPSSGGVVLLQMLGMLEPFDLAALGHNSSASCHLLVEAMRRAYADRSEYFGDPDFVSVPLDGLLDRAYLARRMGDFDPARATPSDRVAPGRPKGWEAIAALSRAAAKESPETTHYSVVDAAGNAVSTTYTLNTSFGSGVTIPGAGFLMNNEMDDFTAKPGTPNFFGLVQGVANAIQPGKRPLSSMTPTIVLQDSRVVLVTGAPGGSTIPNAVLQVLVNVIDHGLPVGIAVEAPRIHHQWMPDTINVDPFGLPADVTDALRARGHQLTQRNLYGPEKKVPYLERYSNDTMTIAIDPASGVRRGAADPRKPDARAVGY
jgi:gamma-glutamyltranspeptidase/glutathione hydrolase